MKTVLLTTLAALASHITSANVISLSIELPNGGQTGRCLQL